MKEIISNKFVFPPQHTNLNFTNLGNNIAQTMYPTIEIYIEIVY